MNLKEEPITCCSTASIEEQVGMRILTQITLLMLPSQVLKNWINLCATMYTFQIHGKNITKNSMKSTVRLQTKRTAQP